MEAILLQILQDNAVSTVFVIFAFLWMRSKFKFLEKKMDDLTEDKRWTETCESTHREVDRRLKRLEAAENSGH